jgi:hypothetical protein
LATGGPAFGAAALVFGSAGALVWRLVFGRVLPLTALGDFARPSLAGLFDFVLEPDLDRVAMSAREATKARES